MQIETMEGRGFMLRPWSPGDAESLVRHANNVRVARNLRDAFPYPYTLGDARTWLEMVGKNREDLILAVEVEGEAAGGIGIHAMKDVYRYNGEIGYWLAEKYWGRGIMTEAVGTMVEYAFTRTRWLRLFATIFQHNRSSMRVLEKNGFSLEAVHKKAVMKEGVLLDEYLFALLKEQWLKRDQSRKSPASRQPPPPPPPQAG
jgi:ribosomal-protein-alanine N-acetyltransferase